MTQLIEISLRGSDLMYENLTHGLGQKNILIENFCSDEIGDAEFEEIGNLLSWALDCEFVISLDGITLNDCTSV
jgi:hypothetical protein